MVGVMKEWVYIGLLIVSALAGAFIAMAYTALQGSQGCA
jgi:hypothetical protein